MREALEKAGVETIAADLLDRAALEKLPKAANVVFMAGRKFGATGDVPLTWAMNVQVPAMVAEIFKASRIVAFSTGCVYPFVPVDSGGATEDVPPMPPSGDYANSCVGRERMFEYFSARHGTPGRLFRLNYAIDMRYGVLHDVGRKVRDGEPIDLVDGPCQRDLAGRCQRGGAALPGARHDADDADQRHGPGDDRDPQAGRRVRQAAGQDADAHRQAEAPTGWLNNAGAHGEGIRAAQRAARQDDRMDGRLAGSATWPPSTSPRTTRCAMASTEPLDVTPIDPEQSDAVWPLSIEAGWNQNVADWRFMLGAGRGFGCAAPDGTWQASSLVLPLGQKLAWISMVLVTKDRRRGGVGTGLLKRCIERGAGRRRRRGSRRDGAGAADLPAAGLSRPLSDRALALRRREGRCGRAADVASWSGRSRRPTCRGSPSTTGR